MSKELTPEDIEADELKRRAALVANGAIASKAPNLPASLKKYDDNLSNLLNDKYRELGVTAEELDKFKNKFNASLAAGKKSDNVAAAEQDPRWARAFLDQLDFDDEVKRKKRFDNAPVFKEQINEFTRTLASEIRAKDPNFQDLAIVARETLKIETHGKDLELQIDKDGKLSPPAQLEAGQGPMTLSFARVRSDSGLNMSEKGAVYDIFYYDKDGKLTDIISPTGEIRDTDGILSHSKVKNLSALQKQLSINRGLSENLGINSARDGYPLDGKGVGQWQNQVLVHAKGDAAAIKIQAAERGRQARAQFKQQNAAATTIQKVVRGAAVRKKATKVKQESIERQTPANSAANVANGSTIVDETKSGIPPVSDVNQDDAAATARQNPPGDASVVNGVAVVTEEAFNDPNTPPLPPTAATERKTPANSAANVANGPTIVDETKSGIPPVSDVNQDDAAATERKTPLGATSVVNSAAVVEDETLDANISQSETTDKKSPTPGSPALVKPSATIVGDKALQEKAAIKIQATYRGSVARGLLDEDLYSEINKTAQGHPENIRQESGKFRSSDETRNFSSSMRANLPINSREVRTVNVTSDAKEVGALSKARVQKLLLNTFMSKGDGRVLDLTSDTARSDNPSQATTPRSGADVSQGVTDKVEGVLPKQYDTIQAWGDKGGEVIIPAVDPVVLSERKAPSAIEGFKGEGKVVVDQLFEKGKGLGENPIHERPGGKTKDDIGVRDGSNKSKYAKIAPEPTASDYIDFEEKEIQKDVRENTLPNQDEKRVVTKISDSKGNPQRTGHVQQFSAPQRSKKKIGESQVTPAFRTKAMQSGVVAKRGQKGNPTPEVNSVDIIAAAVNKRLEKQLKEQVAEQKRLDASKNQPKKPVGEGSYFEKVLALQPKVDRVDQNEKYARKISQNADKAKEDLNNKLVNERVNRFNYHEPSSPVPSPVKKNTPINAVAAKNSTNQPKAEFTPEQEALMDKLREQIEKRREAERAKRREAEHAKRREAERAKRMEEDKQIKNTNPHFEGVESYPQPNTPIKKNDLWGEGKAYGEGTVIVADASRFKRSAAKERMDDEDLPEQAGANRVVTAKARNINQPKKPIQGKEESIFSASTVRGVSKQNPAELVRGMQDGQNSPSTSSSHIHTPRVTPNSSKRSGPGEGQVV